MILIVLPDPAPDDPLLARIRRGDREAVIETYERYFAPLYQYVRFKVGDATLAEDIVSEVFVTLIESLGTRSAPRAHLRGWLFRVARSHISNYLGERHHPSIADMPIDELEDWMPAPPDSNPDQHTLDLFDLQRVRHALRMLADDHQEVLVLRFGQRLSLKETADIMGKSVSAVKSLQFRAMTTLREILAVSPPTIQTGSNAKQQGAHHG